MEQENGGQFEEYVTLRQEMLEVHSFCREILYWTMALLIGSLAWFFSEKRNLDGSTFSMLLLSALFLSYWSYLYYLDQCYRVGSYLAVFWESSATNISLKWHRFHRGIRRLDEYHHYFKSYVPLTTVGMYCFSAILVFLLPFFEQPDAWSKFLNPCDWSRAWIAPAFLTAINTLIFFGGAVIIDSRVRKSENGWRKLKSDAEGRARIHAMYDDDRPPNQAGETGHEPQ